MVIRQHEQTLVVRDTPGCFWLLGLTFVGSGALALAMPFVATNRAEVPWWAKLLVVVVGLAHLAGGVWFTLSHGATHTELNRASGRGRFTTRKPGGQARVEEFALSEVRALEVRRGKDSEGDPTFHLRLWLADGRVLPLHAQPAYGEPWATQHAERVRAFLDLPERRDRAVGGVELERHTDTENR